MAFSSTLVYSVVWNQSSALSSTEADPVASVNYANTGRFLRSILRVLGFPQGYPTPIYEENDHTIDIVNSIIPTEIIRHIDFQLFSIQGWKEAGYIITHHIPGIINTEDDLNKPFDWVLHSRHARYLMGHCSISFG